MLKFHHHALLQRPSYVPESKFAWIVWALDPVWSECAFREDVQMLGAYDLKRLDKIAD